MIVHIKCKHSVVANLSEMGWKILSDFSVRPEEETTFGALDIHQPKKSHPLKFYCENCETDLEDKDVEGICNICGETFSLKELFKIPNVWGDWCESCMVRKGHERTTKVVSLYSLISK